MSTTVISTPLPGNAPFCAQTMHRWTDFFVKDFGSGSCVAALPSTSKARRRSSEKR